MREITNSIDKGGCSELQAAVASCFRDEKFNTELLKIGARSIDYIIEIITHSLEMVAMNSLK